MKKVLMIGVAAVMLSGCNTLGSAGGGINHSGGATSLGLSILTDLSRAGAFEGGDREDLGTPLAPNKDTGWQCYENSAGITTCREKD